MEKKFNVLIWDFNRDELEHYDVLPYLRSCYKKRQERFKKGEDNRYTHVPETLEEFKQFVEDESRYQFWARCEYEMILHSWPPRKDGNEYKLDVYEQIAMNVDIIAEILYQEFSRKEDQA